MNAENIPGNGWTARKTDSVYIVSVADKHSILKALIGFVVTQKITAGQITGMDATNQTTLRLFNPATIKYVDKTFEEQTEICNLSAQ